jgi:hypothetical protein
VVRKVGKSNSGKNDQKGLRVVVFLIGGMILAASGLVYLQVKSMGFPDGFLTDLDRARKVLGNLFIWVSLPTSVWFGVLGWEPWRRESQKGQVSLKQLGFASATYALFVITLWGIDLYLQQHLNHGGGG